METEPAVDILLIAWLVLSVIVLGAALVWVIRRNRGIEKKRDRAEHRHVENDAYRR
jgi:hypothetical protein